ncbi:MAG: hypothetical protein JW739_05735 [Opitutales bacterium]|nr:hypothetical protein [Opitutales bacterium]
MLNTDNYNVACQYSAIELTKFIINHQKDSRSFDGKSDDELKEHILEVYLDAKNATFGRYKPNQDKKDQ